MKRWLFAMACMIFASAGWSQTSTITAVLNAAGQPRIAPGDVALIYGVFPNDRRPSFTVTVGGLPANITVVVIDSKLDHAFEIGFQVPTEIAPGPATLVVTHLADSTASAPVTISPFDPIVSSDPFSAFVHASGQPVTNLAPAAPGETITTFMNGLGATNPAVPTGTQPSTFVPTANAVTATVGGTPATVIFAGRYMLGLPFTALDYQVSFSVPAGTPSGPTPVAVTVGGVTSNTQTLYVGTGTLPAPPVITSVVNGANFSRSTLIAPGSFVTIFGNGFGSVDNPSTFPSTTVNGISVLFNGQPVPIFNLFGTLGQVTVVVPPDTPTFGLPPTESSTNGVSWSVRNGNGPSKAVITSLASSGPAMFAVAGPSSASRHSVAALFAGTAWYVLPASQATAVGLPACAGLSTSARCGQPAKRGDFVQLYATGLGAATPGGDPKGAPLAADKVAPASGDPIYSTAETPVLTIGGLPAAVSFSGLAPGYTGLYQVNFQIPMSAPVGDNVAITLAMPGSAADTATLAIQ